MCGNWLLRLMLRPFAGLAKKVEEIDYPEVWEEFEEG